MAELVFDKYEIIRRIASGGMGDIFLARQVGTPGFERVVILKSLLPELADDEEFVGQFLDEAKVAANLNHPNVVGIYEVGMWGGLYFIAMEYIRGVDLTHLIIEEGKRNSRLPESVTARIIFDAALGLDHAHHATNAKGEPMSIVHRDISPHNIMVRDDGVTKVVDFGIAKAANRSTKTQTGIVKGKIAYMAPEQVHGTTIDHHTDQFALGVVFWEMATGRRLFRGDNAVSTIKKITKHEIPPPSKFVDGFSPLLESVVMRMLEREPEDRFARCSEVSQAIKSYLDSASTDVGQLIVAKCVKQLVGDKIDAVTRDLTPSGEDYVINLRTGEKRGGKKPTSPIIYAGVTLAAIAIGFGLTMVIARDRGEVPPAAETPGNRADWQEAIEHTDLDKPRLALTSTPEGAAVFHGNRSIGNTPLTTSALAPDTPYRLIFELRGYQTAELDLQLKKGDRVARHIDLVATGGGRPSSAGATSPTTSDSAPATGPPTVAAAPPPIAYEPGFVTIKTDPWTIVSVGDRKLGMTPLARIELPAGQHTLRLVNKKAGIDELRGVMIEPGKTLKVNVSLAAATRDRRED